MKIELYEALTGINIDAAAAKEVIASISEHIDMQVIRANEAVLAKLDGLGGKIDALAKGRIDPLEQSMVRVLNDKQLRIQRFRWIFGTVLTMVGLTGAVAGTLRAFHII